MIRILALLFALTAPLNAQEFEPLEYQSTYINDYANIIAPDDKDRITQSLKDLYTEKGVEFTVLTIDRKSRYSSEANLERFATDLFNKWGIGNADRNDGVLLLVIPEDREVRIELGAGYDIVYDGRMLRVIDVTLLPAFRAGNFSEGIEQGVTEIIDRLDVAWQDTEALVPTNNIGFDRLVPYVMAALFGGFFLFALLKNTVADALYRRQPCPNCGARGTLRRTRTVMRQPTYSSTGLRRIRQYCTSCGWNEESDQSISRRTKSGSSSGSFGGGRSSGGGASGRW
ncbi:MAG: TPM domain-containing protein [Pseudomonadota bacterium]